MEGISVKNYIFKPTWFPTVITLGVLYILLSLGLWQLDRAEYKNALEVMLEQRKDSALIGFSDFYRENIFDNDEDWLYQPISISGHYDTKYKIYLDNQVNDRVVGYSIFIPFVINNSKAILVNVGWLPMGNDRNKLPDTNPELTTHLIQIQGLLKRPPSAGIVLSENANNYEEWPTVLQYINSQEISQNIPYKLLPASLLQQENKASNLITLPVKLNMRSEKHTAYAFQWFSLSLALLIIYIVVNTQKIKTD